eukprot:CAMPEP_0183444304 /NCGR_PEP_ID=MMETSP0370-20130417/94607_1 /TAXON_ID=268820 /ORGANISM="Peridinium aciculiferum, Strain PAER-2" /LENGTH=234 /DNA_ID=CAMNT_0025634615 /DNA_START=32 /DNA_END=733 /DNA_ORIENTATION=+
MQHLKECPWDGGQAWRPAVVQQAVSDVKHRADVMASRNYVQHQQPAARLIKPMGVEDTVRAAVRAGIWPTLQQTVNASFMPGGYEEFERTSGSMNKGGTLNQSLMKVNSVHGRAAMGTHAARYNLVKRGEERPLSRADSEEALSTVRSYTSSTSPMARSGCALAAHLMPRSGSSPGLGESYNFRSGNANLMFTTKAMSSGGVQGIVAMATLQAVGTTKALQEVAVAPPSDFSCT